jgi:hypothetical protein
MNNTHVDNSNTKATRIENALHFLSLAFTVVYDYQVSSIYSYY